MNPDWLPWLLQVNDSQFPTGAYSHSMGLEELTRRGLIRTPEDLETFLQKQILPSLLAFEIPFLARSHDAARAADVTGLRQLDEELDAWKLADELRQASRQLGSRRLSLILKLDPDALIQSYAASDPPGHHIIVCALELRRLPVTAACCAYVYQVMSGFTSASMKLIRIGQERCQSILRKNMTAAAPEIALAVSRKDGKIGWFNPLIEIAGMRHARAHERLFIS